MRLRSILFGSALAAGMLVATAGPAVAGPTTEDYPWPAGPYLLTAAHSGQCLDVEGSDPTDGTGAIQYPCHGGANQQWTLVPIRYGQYELHAGNSDKCLDVEGASQDNGARVIEYTCHGGDNQRWRLTPAGGDELFYITAVHSDKCLDVEGASQAPVAPVIQYSCHDGANQQWRFTAA